MYYIIKGNFFYVDSRAPILPLTESCEDAFLQFMRFEGLHDLLGANEGQRASILKLTQCGS